jgi:hypothetical protein
LNGGGAGWRRADRWTIALAGMASWVHACAHGWSGALEADAPHYLAVAASVRNAIRGGHPGTALGLASELAPNPGWVPAWWGLWMLPLGASERVALAAQLPFHILLAGGLFLGGRALGGREGGALTLVLGLATLGATPEVASAMLDLPLAACAAFAGGSLLAGKPGRACVASAAAAWAKLAAPPTLGVLVLEAIREGFTRSSRPWRALMPAAAILLLGYGAGVVALLGGYAGETGNVDASLHGPGALVTRFAGLTAAAVGSLQLPLLVCIVACLLVSRGLRPLAWGLGAMSGLALFTLTPQPRYLLSVAVFASIAAAALVPSGARARGLAWASALACGIALVAGDLGRSVPWGLERPQPASLSGDLETSLGEALRRMDARARESGRTSGDRAVLALQLPDVAPLTAGMAAWIVARDELTILPLPSRRGHPLRADVDLALAVGCGPAATPPMLGRPPDETLSWPGGCVAFAWTSPPQAGGERRREAR